MAEVEGNNFSERIETKTVLVAIYVKCVMRNKDVHL